MKRPNKKPLIELIKRILEHSPECRDCDSTLISNVYFHESSKYFNKDINQVSAFELLKELSHRKFSSAESIRRIRQKIQEDIPSLRGKAYSKRQKHSNTVRQTINTGKNNVRFDY